VHPGAELCCLFSWRKRVDFAVFLWYKFFDIALALFSKLVRSLWHKSCWVDNSGNLSPKQVLFLSKEEWIADDIAFEVTWEQNLDVPGCSDVDRWQVWKLVPLGEWVVSHEVGVLVDSSSLFFLIGILGAVIGTFFSTIFCSFFTSFDGCLNDVIVALGATDLAEESHVSSRLFSGQFLHRLLEQVGLLLAEANSSWVEKSLISQQVLHVAHRGCLRGILTFFFSLGLDEQGLRLFNVRSQVLCLLSTVTVDTQLKELG